MATNTNSNKNSPSEKEVTYSANQEFNEFWIKFGQESITKTLEGFDERAKYMITTCATLIVVDFGILTAFPSSTLIKIVPQFFFAISAALFALSYFPTDRAINLQAPYINRNAYDAWRKFKSKWHKGGFALFIVGLLALALTTMIGNKTIEDENINKLSQTSDIKVNKFIENALSNQSKLYNKTPTETNENTSFQRTYS